MFDPENELEDDGDMTDEGYARLTASFAAEGLIREDGTLDEAALMRDAVVYDSLEDLIAEVEDEAAKAEADEQEPASSVEDIP
jgi:hypothetical protein